MTKKTFIKKLKEKLAILDSNEIDDIVLEYTNIIDDKMKDGKTEKEAILEFGDLDELAKEILKAYKINPNYKEKDEKIDFEECKDSFETWVKRGANKLTEFTKNLFNDIKEKDNDFSVETVFEIIIKAIVLLVLLAILKLPFMLIESLGESIIYSVFFPIDHVLSLIWNLLVWSLYIIACVFVGIAMFKKYAVVNKSEKVQKKTVKEKVEPKVAEVSNEKRAEKVVKNDSSFGNVLYEIIKVFVFICILLPIWLVNLGLIIAIAVIIYYLCVGIELWGVLIILIGCLIVSGHLSHIINNIINRRKNYYFAPFAIGMVMIVIGSLVMANATRYYDYNYMPFELTTKTYEYDINTKTILELDGHYDIKVDNSLPLNRVVVEVSYYDEFTNIDERHRGNRIEIYDHNHMDHHKFWETYDKVIDGLKDKKIIIIDDLDDSYYKVYASEDTWKNLRID